MCACVICVHVVDVSFVSTCAHTLNSLHCPIFPLFRQSSSLPLHPSITLPPISFIYIPPISHSLMFSSLCPFPPIFIVITYPAILSLFNFLYFLYFLQSPPPFFIIPLSLYSIFFPTLPAPPFAISLLILLLSTTPLPPHFQFFHLLPCPLSINFSPLRIPLTTPKAIPSHPH